MTYNFSAVVLLSLQTYIFYFKIKVNSLYMFLWFYMKADSERSKVSPIDDHLTTKITKHKHMNVKAIVVPNVR